MTNAVNRLWKTTRRLTLLYAELARLIRWSSLHGKAVPLSQIELCSGLCVKDAGHIQSTVRVGPECPPPGNGVSYEGEFEILAAP
jgi:hypothetical protein